jgi:ribosomal protein S16
MIRILVRLGKWLDARFPAQVVVTEEDYRMLQERVINHLGMGAQLEARVSAIEESLRAIKDAMSKPSQAAQAMRAQYIATGRMPE